MMIELKAGQSKMKKLTQVELDQVLRKHSLWLEPGGVQGARADLSGASLTGADLFRANLSHADLTGADLTCADLFHANLSHADLTGASLSGASLFHANLTGAQISADTRLHQCSNFEHLTCSPDALPWLILHPKWPEWKSTVTVIEDNPK